MALCNSQVVSSTLFCVLNFFLSVIDVVSSSQIAIAIICTTFGYNIVKVDIIAKVNAHESCKFASEVLHLDSSLKFN
jgi:hypothetical protein